MKKVRIGVLGAFRGPSMINYCKIADNAEVVAICDRWQEGLEIRKKENEGLKIAYFDNFDDFIKYDMDAVVLANYATEHVPFAIRAMESGMHVFSEVMPVQTMKEAVELLECVERTGKIYAYGENYCYMPAPYEMRKLYQEGKIGELEYAKAEYMHNCESIWPSITYGDKNHWRNNMYATFKGVSWGYAEAAFVDGAGHFTVFFKIMLPQVISPLCALFMTQFITLWSDDASPLVYFSHLPTLSTGLYMYQDVVKKTDEYPIYFAGLIICMIPTLALFLVFQKNLMNVQMGGGLKG